MTDNSETRFEKRFRDVSGFSWCADQDARIAWYQATCAALRPFHAGRYMDDAAYLLRLIEIEPKYKPREALLGLLEERIEQGQQIYPQAPRSNDKFFDDLMALGDKSADTRLCVDLICLGLNMQYRGWNLCPPFFNWVCRRVALLAQNMHTAIEDLSPYHADQPDHEMVDGLLIVMNKMRNIVREDPELISQDYADMCCYLVSTPLSTQKIEPKSRRAKDITEYNSSVRERGFLNRSIKNLHNAAVGSVREMVFRVAGGKSRLKTHHLFTSDNLTMLRKAGETSYVGVNAVMLPDIWLTALKASYLTRPPLRGVPLLTYDPPKPPKPPNFYAQFLPLFRLASLSSGTTPR